jgi:hypothetical protein
MPRKSAWRCAVRPSRRVRVDGESGVIVQDKRHPRACRKAVFDPERSERPVSRHRACSGE